MASGVHQPLEQGSFDDLGTPLSEVTFCVLDIETTGGSPVSSAITEIGACKVRRGEVVGTFHSLVDPGEPVPAFIRLLTGITDQLLSGAPDIHAVLPNLIEFVKDAVLVAHNARFDVGFLNAALRSADYPPLDNRVVDTAALARKILAGEVPNNRLETLARQLRCAHQPCHRAYADVLATVDVLHHLIERVAGFGITTLEDLAAVSSSRMDGTFRKIALADPVPPGIGVYRFVGATGQTLYVGKATDLRSRVRSYFYGDPRARIRNLLRETQSISYERHSTMLEAEIAEARAIVAEQPPYNRAGKRSGTWHLKVTLRGGRAKVSSARVVKNGDGNLYVGPFASMRTVRTLVDGLRDAVALHRCAEPARCNGCAFSELGTCAGTDRVAHAGEVGKIVTAIEREPDLVLKPLVAKMTRLAAQERYEEAAELRDRGALLERALHVRLERRSLEAAGDVTLAIGNRVVTIRGGRLDGGDAATDPRVLSSWLRRGAEDARIVSVSGTWAMPATARPKHHFKQRS